MEYGLIGEHLGHSYSKLIQEELLDNYVYEIHPVAKEDLDAFMKNKSFKAINVTIPYKKDVIPYLNFIDDTAKKIGAVNTIVNRDGILHGYNTDYYGFRYMVEKHTVSLNGKKVIVLGNGGASQAIQAVVQDLGASVMIVTDIVQMDNVVSIDEVYQNHKDANIVINTTPCGMYPNTQSKAIDLDKLDHVEAVFDCVYNPMDTLFTLQAKQKGIQIAVTGLEMLVGQAKKALEIFKDIQISDTEIDRIYRLILKMTSNLITTNSDKELIESVSKILNKEVIYANQDTISKVAYQSNKIIVVPYMDTAIENIVIANGFIVNQNSVKNYIQVYDESILSF